MHFTLHPGEKIHAIPYQLVFSMDTCLIDFSIVLAKVDAPPSQFHPMFLHLKHQVGRPVLKSIPTSSQSALDFPRVLIRKRACFDDGERAQREKRAKVERSFVAL